MGCFPKKENDKAVVWHCIPLAVYAIGFAALQTAWPLYSIIVQSRNNQADQRVAGTVSYVFNGMQMVFGFVALVSVLAKWLPGIRFYDSCLQFLVITWLGYVVIMIVLIFLKKSDYVGVDGQGIVWATALITLIGATLLCILAFFMRSCSASLIMVIDCGGNGFEKLNYKQLKTGVARRAFTRADSDNETISDFNAEP